MTMSQIIEKARILGVKNYSRLRKADLIRAHPAKGRELPLLPGHFRLPGTRLLVEAGLL